MSKCVFHCARLPFRPFLRPFPVLFPQSVCADVASFGRHVLMSYKRALRNESATRRKTDCFQRWQLTEVQKTNREIATKSRCFSAQNDAQTVLLLSSLTEPMACTIHRNSHTTPCQQWNPSTMSAFCCDFRCQSSHTYVRSSLLL